MVQEDSEAWGWQPPPECTAGRRPSLTDPAQKSGQPSDDGQGSQWITAQTSCFSDGAAQEAFHLEESLWNHTWGPQQQPPNGTLTWPVLPLGLSLLSPSHVLPS